MPGKVMKGNHCRVDYVMMIMADNRERRQHPRFKVNEGTFAFIDNIPFSILNISAGGVKLQSVLYDDAPRQQMSLDFFLKNENFYLQDIPVRLVRIRKSFARTSFATTQLSCVGLQFGELTEQQKSRLDYFISRSSELEI